MPGDSSSHNDHEHPLDPPSVRPELEELDASWDAWSESFMATPMPSQTPTVPSQIPTATEASELLQNFEHDIARIISEGGDMTGYLTQESTVELFTSLAQSATRSSLLQSDYGQLDGVGGSAMARSLYQRSSEMVQTIWVRGDVDERQALIALGRQWQVAADAVPRPASHQHGREPLDEQALTRSAVQADRIAALKPAIENGETAFAAILGYHGDLSMTVAVNEHLDRVGDELVSTAEVINSQQMDWVAVSSELVVAGVSGYEMDRQWQIFRQQRAEDTEAYERASTAYLSQLPIAILLDSSNNHQVSMAATEAGTEYYHLLPLTSPSAASQKHFDEQIALDDAAWQAIDTPQPQVNTALNGDRALIDRLASQRRGDEPVNPGLQDLDAHLLEAQALGRMDRILSIEHTNGKAFELILTDLRQNPRGYGYSAEEADDAIERLTEATGVARTATYVYRLLNSGIGGAATAAGGSLSAALPVWNAKAGVDSVFLATSLISIGSTEENWDHGEQVTAIQDLVLLAARTSDLAKLLPVIAKTAHGTDVLTAVVNGGSASYAALSGIAAFEYAREGHYAHSLANGLVAGGGIARLVGAGVGAGSVAAVGSTVTAVGLAMQLGILAYEYAQDQHRVRQIGEEMARDLLKNHGLDVDHFSPDRPAWRENSDQSMDMLQTIGVIARARGVELRDQVRILGEAELSEEDWEELYLVSHQYRINQDGGFDKPSSMKQSDPRHLNSAEGVRAWYHQLLQE